MNRQMVRNSGGYVRRYYIREVRVTSACELCGRMVVTTFMGSRVDSSGNKVHDRIFTLAPYCDECFEATETMKIIAGERPIYNESWDQFLTDG